MPTPMRIGSPPSTVPLLSTLSSPIVYSVYLRHAIKCISSAVGSSMLKYWAKHLTSPATLSLQNVMITISLSSMFPASVTLSLQSVMITISLSSMLPASVVPSIRRL